MTSKKEAIPHLGESKEKDKYGTSQTTNFDPDEVSPEEFDEAIEGSEVELTPVEPVEKEVMDSLPEELLFQEGEDLYSWLERCAKQFLTELATVGLARRGVSDRVKLEALKELIMRPLPPKSIYELRPPDSELEKYTDAELREYIQSKLPQGEPEKIEAKVGEDETDQ